MFIINQEELSISATRGDVVFFRVQANDGEAQHTFEAGDIVRVSVYGKKDPETVYLQKDFPVFEQAQTVEVYLSGEDTKFGELISKPTDYWYEIVVNPDTSPKTIIGYDDNGAKVFRLFPESETEVV